MGWLAVFRITTMLASFGLCSPGMAHLPLREGVMALPYHPERVVSPETVGLLGVLGLFEVVWMLL